MIMKPQLTIIEVQYQYYGQWQPHSNLCWSDHMERSVFSSRGKKLQSIHYSSQVDCRVENQSLGKQKEKLGPGEKREC